ncbi:MAG TPA: hypothetical protein VND24_07025 [Steroidobacteraceae bacterium]|nr:hypothetical protein [Steroidobacteraceae bacterium]
MDDPSARDPLHQSLRKGWEIAPGQRGRYRARVDPVILVAAVLFASACRGAGGQQTSRTATPAVPPGTSVGFGFDAATAGPAAGRYAVTGTLWALRPEAGAPSAPNAVCRVSPNASDATLLVASPNYADLTDSVSLKPLEAGGSGLIVRARDARDYYLVAADAAAGTISIEVARNGTLHTLSRVDAPVQPNTWQELSAQVRGTEITAFLDGRGLAHAHDTAFASGGIGLWSAPGASACFDNLMATGL